MNIKVINNYLYILIFLLLLQQIISSIISRLLILTAVISKSTPFLCQSLKFMLVISPLMLYKIIHVQYAPMLFSEFCIMMIFSMYNYFLLILSELYINLFQCLKICIQIKKYIFIIIIYIKIIMNENKEKQGLI